MRNKYNYVYIYTLNEEEHLQNKWELAHSKNCVKEHSKD